MKKILITGAAGYIGSMLCTKLVDEGYKVTAVDILKYEKNSLAHLFSKKNFTFLKLDITKKKNLKKIILNQDFIIPLAALVVSPLCEKKKKEAVKVNVDSIKLLLSVIKKRQKILYPTTNSGYGIGQKSKFCDENTVLNPISLYGRTKVEAEELISKHSNYICFRLATVFGYSFRMRTDLIVNNFVETAVKKGKLEIFEPNFRRNFIHIQDIVDAFLFSIKNFNKLKNNIFNLGLSSANISKINLARKIKKIVPKTTIIINKKGNDPDKRDYYVSNKKIENKGFKAKIDIDEGILELIEVYKSHKDFINNY